MSTELSGVKVSSTYLQGHVAEVLVLPHVVEGHHGVVLESSVSPDEPRPLRTQLDHLGVEVVLGVRGRRHVTPVAVVMPVLTAIPMPVEVRRKSQRDIRYDTN